MMTTTSVPKAVSYTISLILLVTLALLIFTYFYNNYHHPTTGDELYTAPVATTHSNCSAKPAHADLSKDQSTATVAPDIRLFIGVLTVPGQYARRSLLRLAYAHQPRPAAALVDVRFVFCDVSKEEDRVLVALEIIQYDDIVVLNCTENMDSGKTYTYFSSMPKLFPPYDYVMKSDDDTYVRVKNLVESLRTTPRQSLYYGLTVPCIGTRTRMHWMSGMGYVLSWDLVDWIANSDVPKRHSNGPEDMLIAEWFMEGKRAVNMYDGTPGMYDYFDKQRRCYRHEFIPDTTVVHKLKDNSQWAKTLLYFRATDGIQPSKQYDVLLKYLHS